MSVRDIYLDYNAGGPVRPAVAAAMAEALGEAGNPSAVHRAGRQARRRLEEARAAVAGLVGAVPEGVVFTSGGTEANLMVLRGCGRSRRLVSAVEHVSVLDAAPEARILPVDGDGLVDVAELDRLLARPGPAAVVSVMLANNETGVIQPVAAVAEVARRHGALVHCDAAQAAGRIPVSLAELGVDFLTLSAAKLGGAAGVGAVVMADADGRLAPLLPGGQERRRRGGSENLAGIAGFGAAAVIAGDDLRQGHAILEMCQVRDALERAVSERVPQARVIGQGVPRLPNTACLALPGVPAQTQVMALDLAGVMVSAGAACSSGKVAASHVLEAMGLPAAVAASAIRVSLGWASVAADADRFLEAWGALAARKGLEFRAAAMAA